MPGGDIRVSVIGGGIGGLAAALALLQSDHNVHVYEQASVLTDIGAGIQISPNASRLLHRLGLAEAMSRCGVKPLWRHQRRWQDGRTLARGPLGAAAEARFGAPYYNFHRADLIALLAAAVPPDRVHLGHRLAAIADDGRDVEARFTNGTRVRSDILIGADGIHSAVRTAIIGPEAPVFTGCVAYRGLVPAERVRDLSLPLEAQNWLGPGRHLVHYFVARAQLVNIVCVIEQNSWKSESWTDRGSVADLLAAYEGWHPDVMRLIGAMDETYKWALFDRPPLPRWSFGRVTLLGDSCHPMLPMMAQGAAQAIEDGATLVGCLAGVARHGVEAALLRYEQLRLPRASRLQAMSRANKTNFHLSDGPEQIARDARIASGGTDWAATSVDWLYDHDAGRIA